MYCYVATTMPNGTLSYTHPFHIYTSLIHHLRRLVHSAFTYFLIKLLSIHSLILVIRHNLDSVPGSLIINMI